jgi:hypothetical protein
MRCNPKLTITAHSAVRMRQRGYHVDDFATVENLGTHTAGGVLLRKKDVYPEQMRLSEELKSIRSQKVSDLKSARCSGEREIIRQLKSLRRLVGTYIPTAGGCALSIYRPCSRRLKYILDGRRASSRRFQKRWPR